MKKITFITCGGTIDKDYATSKWSYDFMIGEPKVQDILDKLRLNMQIDIVSILAKDSLDMNDEDRKIVLNAVKNSPSENIIITHGTDTMIDTAKVLQSIPFKRIILVGSSLPYIFRNSDADFNIWFAVGSVNTLSDIWKTWVYISMNGMLFDSTKVEKGEDGVFRRVD